MLNFIQDLNDGFVIPIISSSFLLNRIFSSIGCNYTDSNIKEQVAEKWAKNTQYPFLDNYSIENVAQFNFFIKQGVIDIKTGYINAVKELLKDQLKEFREKEFEHAIKEKIFDKSLSEIMIELRSLTPPEDQKDGFSQLLDSGRINYYFTTCAFDFIENEFKYIEQPYFTLTFGEQQPVYVSTKNGVQEDYNVKKPQYPLIYHVFGHETEPKDMILAEDEHIKFLVDNFRSNTGDAGAPKPPVPGWLIEKRDTYTLLFLGFHWQDWEFRTLFRWITGLGPKSRQRIQFNHSPSVIVQQEPGSTKMKNEEMNALAKQYLGEYFCTGCNVQIYWQRANDFIIDLIKAI